jgi:hypothetical protein
VAADCGAGRLADRAETIGDRDAGGDLKLPPGGRFDSLASGRSIGEAEPQRLLEAPQVLRLAERELALRAAQALVR